MKDLTSSRAIKFKGGLFLFMGLLSSVMLIVRAPSLQNAALLTIAIWSFARFYYFCFYVIERYVDPSFRFSGLGSAIRYLLKVRSKKQ